MSRPRDISDILSRLPDAKDTGDEWRASCPCEGHRAPEGHLSLKDAGDKALITCHSGRHSYQDICNALGFDSLNYAGGVGSRIVTTYDYTNIEGKLLYQVVRFDPKGFRQRQPDNNGGWVWNLKGITLVLYHLPDVVEAVGESRTIYICEGEKDADNLATLGLRTTTNSGGAQNWQSKYCETLVGASVVILPDKDDAGRERAVKVAASLHGSVLSLKVAELPDRDMCHVKDVSDWLAAGGTLLELEHFVNETLEWEPAQNKQSSVEPITSAGHLTDTTNGEYHRTDIGNAERLIARHGKDLRFCYRWNKWLVWDGTRWLEDEGGGIGAKAKDTVRGIYKEVSETEDAGERKSLVRFALNCEQAGRIESLIKMARNEPGIGISPDDLDKDIMLLNLENGTVDLRTSELKAHNRADLITKKLPINYKPKAECELWLAFLNEIMDGDNDLIGFFQRAIGYSLSGDTSERCMFICHGSGANGKSTIFTVLGKILDGFAIATPTQTLMAKKYEGIPNDVAQLKGARFVTAAESGVSQRFDEGLIKQLTGNDKVEARFMRSEWFSFMPTHKLWLATNHKPIIKGTDKAIWDRIRLIPFDVGIPEEKQDKHLAEKLMKKAEGILAWAVRGCLSWQQNGLGTPSKVKKATATYREEMDILATWLDECCFVGEHYSASSKSLNQSHQEWCRANGEQVSSQRTLGLALGERGFVKEKTRTVIIWRGIGLKEDAPCEF